MIYHLRLLLLICFKHLLARLQSPNKRFHDIHTCCIFYKLHPHNRIDFTMQMQLILSLIQNPVFPVTSTQIKFKYSKKTKSTDKQPLRIPNPKSKTAIFPLFQAQTPLNKGEVRKKCIPSSQKLNFKKETLLGKREKRLTEKGLTSSSSKGLLS